MSKKQKNSLPVPATAGKQPTLAEQAHALRMNHQHDAALEKVLAALAENPQNPEFFLLLSMIWHDIKQYTAAKNCLIKVLSLNHEHANGHLCLGQLLMAEGDFRVGWEEMHWRLKTEMGKKGVPPMTSMPWNGMPVGHANLLAIGDQGFGDVIQFSRYLPQARERVGKLIVATDKSMVPLFEGWECIDECVHLWTAVPGHAMHTQISDLPRLLDVRAGNIIPPIPMTISAEKHMAAYKLLGPSTKFRIGLVWSGRPTHPNNARRSLTLSDYAPIINSFEAKKNFEFVSLQKPVPDNEGMLMMSLGMMDHSEFMQDWGDTAAMVKQMDLVITIDSAVAHLAGSLGVPVMVLIPQPCDWRWRLDGTTTEWYPSMQLFRQEMPGAWDAPINEIIKELTNSY